MVLYPLDDMLKFGFLENSLKRVDDASICAAMNVVDNPLRVHRR